MANSNFLYTSNKKSLDSLYALSALAGDFVGTSNIFELSSMGYTDQGVEYSFCKGSNYNGGTWGKYVSTAYNYNSNDVIPIPFMNKDTCPLPYLSANGYRWFSTSSNDVQNWHSYTKFIALDNSSQYHISYDGTNILVKKADSTIYTIKASPYIFLSIQARGGAGGAGYYANAFWSGEYYYTSGGGGGSGAFAEFTFNLSNLANGVYLSHQSLSLTVDFGNQCFLRYGAAGTDSGETASGMGGAGGTISYGDSTGMSISSPNITDAAYILNAIPGAAGGNGGRRQTGILYSSGSASSNLSTRVLKLSSAGVTANACIASTSMPSTVGVAYGSTSGTDVAGGGGAPSIMSNGNSGSYGAGAHGGHVESKEVKSAGTAGGGAIWLTYIKH